jgi:peroxiredoxin family protein
MTTPLSIVLFSGTDDKLHAAATLIAGAAVMGRPVNCLLQFWALDAFRAERIGGGGRLACEAAPGARTDTAALPWVDTFRMAKELGEVQIRACSGSLDYLHLDVTELDPMVDGAAGVAAFMADAGDDSSITFI